jgi:BirA family transcriptional regulator, biotin operon repressor / biotin---[acetyl-CoA-carboxylase] ligase
LFKPTPPKHICGQPVIYLDQVASTNDYAKQQLAENEISTPVIVLTQNQMSGKGRRGNYWFSEPGKDLVFSYLVPELAIPVKNQFWLTQMVSISILETLIFYKPHGRFSIKWPNDILLGGRKIAGVLIENTVQNNLLETSVLGVGININQKNNVENGISLSHGSPQEIEPFEVLEILVKKMQSFFKKPWKDSSQSLSLNYTSQLFGIDQWVEFGYRDLRLKGILKEVTPEGALIILHGQIMRKYLAGEVEKLTFD